MNKTAGWIVGPIAFGLITVAIVVGICLGGPILFDNWPHDNALLSLDDRLGILLKVAGGGLAIIGIVIAAWRSVIAGRQAKAMTESAQAMTEQAKAMTESAQAMTEQAKTAAETAQKQANTATEQVKIAQKGQYSDRFIKAVEQVADHRLAVRLGGLASLRALSDEETKEYIRVWHYLGDFLRYPPDLSDWPPAKDAQEAEEKEPTPIGKRPDIAAIVTMISERDPEHLKKQGDFLLPLSKANLVGAEIFRGKLQRVDLSEACLQQAELEGTDLRGVNLRWAKLQKANLRGTQLQKADLRWAKLQEAKLEFAKLGEASLGGASLGGAKLQYAGLQKADLKQADMQGAELQGADLSGVGLFQATLSGADLQEADLKGGNLRMANLYKADLQAATLSGASLQDANLQGATLQGADLQGATLQGADLQGATLQGADLRGAYLGNAQLQWVDLRGADLRNVRMVGNPFVYITGGQEHKEASKYPANLFGALLGGVVITREIGSESYLEQDLTQCKNLTPNQTKEAFYDKESFYPILPEWEGSPWPKDYWPQPISVAEWKEKRDEWFLKQQDRPENQ